MDTSSSLAATSLVRFVMLSPEKFQTKNKLIVTKDKQRSNFSGTLDILFCRSIKTFFICYRLVIQCQNFVQAIQFVPKSFFLFFNKIVS